MDCGKPVSMEHDHAAYMAGGGMPLMPGKLTAAQMETSEKGKGSARPRLRAAPGLGGRGS